MRAINWVKDLLMEKTALLKDTLHWWARQNLIALDQAFNALAGGWADETLSARLWRRRGSKAWRRAQKMVDAIFFWQPGHCRQAYLSEQARLHCPPSLRDNNQETKKG